MRKPNGNPMDLDALLESDEAARWLRMRKQDLLAKAKGKRAKIPGFWINQRVVRFHPRTVIAKLAADAGCSFELIAASLNQKPTKP